MNEAFDAQSTRWELAVETLSSIVEFDNGYVASNFILGLERFGHDPRYPVTRDWPHLVDELLDDIASHHRDEERPQVWLVGHSLGGYLSLMAALKRPQWVRGVVMLDSPVIGGWRR